MPKCHYCGKRKWFVDKWRIRHETHGRGPTCACGGYPFLHRRGSKFCYHNPNAEAHHTERHSH
jgi:hypothetical protein